MDSALLALYQKKRAAEARVQNFLDASGRSSSSTEAATITVRYGRENYEAMMTESVTEAVVEAPLTKRSTYVQEARRTFGGVIDVFDEAAAMVPSTEAGMEFEESSGTEVKVNVYWDILSWTRTELFLLVLVCLVLLCLVIWCCRGKTCYTDSGVGEEQY